MTRKIINWGTNEDFIKKYEELKSSRKMGEFYHCDKTSVLNHAKAVILKKKIKILMEKHM